MEPLIRSHDDPFPAARARYRPVVDGYPGSNGQVERPLCPMLGRVELDGGPGEVTKEPDRSPPVHLAPTMLLPQDTPQLRPKKIWSQNLVVRFQESENDRPATPVPRLR